MIDDDPALYVTGIWGRLSEAERSLIDDTRDGPAAKRRQSWHTLRLHGSPEALALSLDLFLADRAGARFGQGVSHNRKAVRGVASRLLGLPAFDGHSRFGERVAGASHVVALRSLALVAGPDDADILPPLPRDLAIAGEFLVAWGYAAGEILRLQGSQPDARLVATLSTTAADESIDAMARTGAAVAIGASPGSAAITALHGLAREAEGDVRIEALAALARHRQLEADEIETIRVLLTQSQRSSSFTIREDDLHEALVRADITAEEHSAHDRQWNADDA